MNLRGGRVHVWTLAVAALVTVGLVVGAPSASACSLALPGVSVAPTTVNPGQRLEVNITAYDIVPESERPPSTTAAPGQPQVAECPPTRAPARLTLRFVQPGHATELASFGQDGWPHPVVVSVPRNARAGVARLVASTPSATYQSNPLTVVVRSAPAVPVDAQPTFTG